MNAIKRAECAVNYFYNGYNCAQAVTLAFQDLLELDEKTLAKLASSFGGGMGRLREVCGAVSAMFLVYGMIKGYDDPSAKEEKAEQYKIIQKMAAEFEKKQGSVICRDILKKPEGHDDYIPADRTKEYYESRPCTRCVMDAAEILEIFLRK